MNIKILVFPFLYAYMRVSWGFGPSWHWVFLDGSRSLVLTTHRRGRARWNKVWFIVLSLLLKKMNFQFVATFGTPCRTCRLNDSSYILRCILYNYTETFCGCILPLKILKIHLLAPCCMLRNSQISPKGRYKEGFLILK